MDVTLPTGLRVAGERLERSQAVALALRLPAGAKDDPGNKLGLAYLVKETLLKGTRKHDARALSDAFDFYGIHHGEYTGTESTLLQIRCLPEHLKRALALLREVLSQPTFPQAACETAKSLALQELKHLEDDPMTKCFVLLKELYFGTEWGHTELGVPQTVPEVSRQDIAAFWSARYIPAGTIASVAGAFDSDAVLKELETLFANSGPAWPLDAPPPALTQSLRKHEQKDSEQTQIALAFPAVPHNHPSYFAARLAVGVLAGGMSGRLFTEVREKRGLAYSVGAHITYLRGTGLIAAYAGTTAARAAETLKVLKDELVRVGQDVTEEELERAKIGVKSRLLMDQESTYHRSRELLDDLYYEGRIVPLDEVVQKINAVTVNDVKSYWTSHPVDPHALVTLGRDALEQ
jgi:predicted Zn-dependent peptidase